MAKVKRQNTAQQNLKPLRGEWRRVQCTWCLASWMIFVPEGSTTAGTLKRHKATCSCGQTTIEEY